MEKTKLVDVYVHGSDESMWEAGEKLHLSGEALSMFSHAADEFKITLSVDMSTGLANVVKIDGKSVVNNG